MESLVGSFEKYGLAGLVIACLFFALYKIHNAEKGQSDEIIEQHEAERNQWSEQVKLIFAQHETERRQWHDDIQSLTKAFIELTAKLPTFCGERRYKPPPTKKVDDY